MLRYLAFTTICDVLFGLFMLSWLITRLFLFLLAIKSSFIDMPRVIPRVWDPSTGRFMTKEVHMVFNAMLVSLQVRPIGNEVIQ